MDHCRHSGMEPQNFTKTAPASDSWQEKQSRIEALRKRSFRLYTLAAFTVLFRGLTYTGSPLVFVPFIGILLLRYFLQKRTKQQLAMLAEQCEQLAEEWGRITGPAAAVL